MLSSLVAAVVAVVVEGDTTCPSPARVGELLRSMPAVASSGEPHRARLAEQHDRIDLELRSVTGRSLGKKTFASSAASCDELASAIAVTIATWEAALAGDAPSIDVALSPEPASRPGARATIEIGAALLGSIDRSGTTVGGLGELAIAWPRWSVRLAAVVTSRKTDDLAPGHVTWARHAIVVGARYRIAGDVLRVAAGGDAVLGALVARGDGFTENRTSYSFDPGVAPALRATWRRSAVDVFVEVSDTIWLRGGRLHVTGVTTMPDLPRHEARIGLGLEVRLTDR